MRLLRTRFGIRIAIPQASSERYPATDNERVYAPGHLIRKSGNVVLQQKIGALMRTKLILTFPSVSSYRQFKPQAFSHNSRRQPGFLLQYKTGRRLLLLLTIDLVAVDGSNRVKLIAPFVDNAPQLFRMSWSLDGKRFASSGITTFDADGSNRRWIVTGYRPAWVQ